MPQQASNCRAGSRGVKENEGGFSPGALSQAQISSKHVWVNISVSDVVARTPPWVFVLFAYLLWIGIMRLRPSVRDVGKTWITPGIFIVWGVARLFHRPGDFSYVATHWGIAAVIGGVLGSLGGMKKMLVDRPRQLVRLRGSVMPLIRIILIFGAHYLLNVAAAVHPENQSTFLAWDIYVSGASAGYFFGWSLRFLRAYRTAPQVDLAPVVARLKRRASA